jgi:hypothetical protein
VLDELDELDALGELSALELAPGAEDVVIVGAGNSSER